MWEQEIQGKRWVLRLWWSDTTEEQNALKHSYLIYVGGTGYSTSVSLVSASFW